VSRRVLAVLALATVAVIVHGRLEVTSALLGLVAGMLIVGVSGAGRGPSLPLATLPRRAIFLALYVLVLVPLDLARANARLARRLLARTPDIRPGIVRVPLETTSDAAIAIEQHALTLSPGQMLIEHDAKAGMAYVHFVDVREAEARRGELRRLSRRVLERLLQ
jgi:multicomponent Na+:H+ antiporter subunit E